MQFVNAWFVRPPRFGLRPLTENHLFPCGDIPPPLFNAQVQPSLSRIFMHSGRMFCALAVVAKRQNDPRSAALPAVTNIHSSHYLAKLAAKHYPTRMPTGPKGQKRPADVNARAVMIAKIATGEIADVTTDDGKNAAAVALGRMGGKARAAGMSAKKRKEIAKKAAKARWEA